MAKQRPVADNVTTCGLLQEEAPEKYQSHFSRWLEAGVDPEDIEDLYKSVSGRPG